DADRIINDPEIELVYIASNHASHAEYAIEALKVGKSVHIEKPHVVGEDQLKRLCEAMTESKGRVSLGFNRPKSRIGKAIKYYLDTQSGPSMFNWFVAGHKIPPDHWYFKEQEGGRVLGNLCHWTDFVLQLVARKNRYPLTITPTRSERADCDIAVTYVFGDGSVAALTFSTKSEPFEGIRERFAAQRGEVLISMDDFKSLTVEVAHRKYKISPMFRDHGHELNVTNSYEMIRPRGDNEVAECPIDYVWDTGMLFLKTRQALEEDRRIVVHPFDPTLPLTSEKDDLAA
ncbi:MAG TPA: Gfo/Idh/MocA family oxidoreductase, partial [Thermoguttaceae bacterium]|nr:Gfo/Idh/MocA family oxidoreductase [Thermoguttaceae bacterium]